MDGGRECIQERVKMAASIQGRAKMAAKLE
jgi:hypothetical protein